MDTGQAKKEETVKACLLIMGYLVVLALVVQLTVRDPALGQYVATGALALGLIFVLVSLAKTWIEVENAGERD